MDNCERAIKKHVKIYWNYLLQNDNNNNNNNMNMGGGRKMFEDEASSGEHQSLKLMNFVETINDRFQMVDRAIQTVYPSCHEAYQCHYGSKILELLPK